jgi:thymidylate synthase (FAD)
VERLAEVMINGYDIEVKLLAVTAPKELEQYLPKTISSSEVGPEYLIEYAGRLCRDSTIKIGTNPRRIRQWMEMGHESIIEHASATFYIKCSRVLTQELVRHRLASYSQRSQRYVKEPKPRYITPPEVSRATDKNSSQVFEDAMEHAWLAYNDLLKLGIKPEIARYVLPTACETQIVMTMNFRELRHFIKLRTSERALPEMRAVAGEILRIMKVIAPQVFCDF